MTALKTPIADFIEFMLHEILLALKKRQGKLLNQKNYDIVKDAVDLIKKYPRIKKILQNYRVVRKLQEDQIIIASAQLKLDFGR